MESKKFVVRLNNEDKVEQLLQETYNLACQQYKTLQDEINKITHTTVLNSLDIDGKEKYGKIMNNYISLQQKSIAQKMDIAKLLSDIIKHNGDLKGALDDAKGKGSTLDLNKLRELAVRASAQKDETEEYKIKDV